MRNPRHKCFSLVFELLYIGYCNLSYPFIFGHLLGLFSPHLQPDPGPTDRRDYMINHLEDFGSPNKKKHLQPTVRT